MKTNYEIKKILIPIKASEELPEKLDVNHFRSDNVIAIFSDRYVDYCYYDYHEEVWYTHDGDNLKGFTMKYWYKPMSIDELLPSDKELDDHFSEIEEENENINSYERFAGAKYIVNYIKNKLK